MNLIPCRDCGNLIDPNSRGCSTCAMNLDAERMFDRFVLGGFILAAIVATVIVLLFFLRNGWGLRSWREAFIRSIEHSCRIRPKVPTHPAQ